LRIETTHAGRIQQITVTEGQEVKAGQVLMYVDPDPVLVNGRAAARAEIERLNTVEDELNTSIKDVANKVSTTVSGLSDRMAAITQQIHALQNSYGLQEQNIVTLESQLEAGKTLKTSGAMSNIDIQRREAALRDAKIAGQNLLFSLHEKEELLADLARQKSEAPIDGALRISELRRSLVETAQRRNEAEGKLAFQITAPSDGTVDTILAASGQTVDANAPVISLLPDSASLFAELYVPSRAVAFLEPTQTVRIAYDAFPYTHYGLAEGKIRSVSGTVLKPEEIGKPISIREPSYRVDVTLDRQTMRSGNKDIRLRPGLTLSADIILDRQSLAQWILRSIKELWARS